MKDVVVDDKLELKYFMEKSDPFQNCTYYDIYCKKCNCEIGYQLVR